MQMPGRTFNSSESRFGFNGQEKVDEIAGNGNHYTAEFWEYDPRTGERWNNDPVVKAWESPYATFSDNPILNNDPKGDTDGNAASGEGEGGGKTGSCETCPKYVPEKPLVAKDQVLINKPVPKTPIQEPSKQAFIGPNNDTPEVQQIKSDNALRLENGGTGLGLGQQSIYKAGLLLKAIDDLPATVTLPLFALSGGTSSVAGTGRVFWSGGSNAMKAAATFAGSTGGTTLEMTTAGKVMTAFNPLLPRSVSAPIWSSLSTNFAKGAVGEAHFFPGAIVKPTSIWMNIEKPILVKNGVNIITH